MILDRLNPFKKSLPTDSTKRRQVIAELAADDPALLDLAASDPDAGIRAAIVARLNDLAAVSKLAIEDSDEGVKQVSRNRLASLIAQGTTPPAEDRETDLAMREAMLDALDDELLGQVLALTEETVLKEGAITRLGEAGLMEVILGDGPLVLRQSLLDRIENRSALEKLNRALRNKDKRLSRQVQTKLDAIRAVEARQEALEDLCRRIELLSQDSNISPQDTRLHALELAWADQANLATPADTLKARFEKARSSILNRQHETLAERLERLGFCGLLEDLLKQLDPIVELTPTMDELINTTLDEIAKHADEIEARAETQRIERLKSQIDEKRKALTRDRDRASKWRNLVHQAELLLRQPVPRDRDLQKLQQSAQQAEKPSESLATPLVTRFEQLMAEIHQRSQNAQSRRESLAAAFDEKLKQLEAILTEGDIQQATELEEKLRQEFKEGALHKEDKTKFNERLLECRAKLNELRGWRKWGTQQAREHLCEAAETLIESAETPIEIANRIKQLRQEWKAIDHKEGAASKPLWDRFNQAAEKAYEPCTAYFAELQRLRQQITEKCAALCEQLEVINQETDWNQPQWRDIDKTRRDLVNQWMSLTKKPDDEARPMVPGSLIKRYRSALSALDERLKAERIRDFQRRQQLVEQAKSLVEQDGNTIDEVKRLQSEWVPTVRSRRDAEQKLWEDFKAACDAVFNKRQAQRDEVDKEFRDNLVTRQRLCEELETLANSDLATFLQSRNRVKEIEAAWGSSGKVPRNDIVTIEKRYKNALANLEKRRKYADQEKREQQLQSLQKRAELCEQLEARLGESEHDLTLEAVHQQWVDLPTERSPAQAILDKRYATVVNALKGDAKTLQQLQQQLSKGVEEAQKLCLRMEILAGIDSPPEFAQARMKFQVERLNSSLKSRSNKTPSEEAFEVQQSWYGVPLPTGGEAECLKARFNKALNAYQQRKP